MDHSSSLTIAIWLWVVLAAIAVIAAAISSVITLIEDDWYPAAIIVVCFVASFGFLYLSIAVLGYPIIATWSWRILAGTAVCFGLLGCIRSTMKSAEAGEIFSLVGVFAGSIVVFLLSIRAVWRFPTGQTGLASGFVSPSSQALDNYQIIIWHHVALVILLLATLLFVSLFLFWFRRNPIAVESHWGGLGGGLGGWRISPSLSFLLLGVVFGALFSIFLLQEESSVRKRLAGSVPKEASAPKSDEKPRSTETNNPTNASLAPTKPTEGPPAK